MEKKEFFIVLRDYFKNRATSQDLMDADPNVYDVREDRSNRGLTKIKLQFKNDFIAKLLGLQEEDISFYNWVNSPYDSWSFVDSYQVQENFLEGWGIWYYFNEENIELLKKIAKWGFSMDFDINDEDSKKELAKFLSNSFPKETDSILNDFESEKNYEMNQFASKSMEEDLKDAFEGLPFKSLKDDSIELTVGELTVMYLESDLLHESIKNMLRKVFENKDFIGGWFENSYEYQNDEYFDSESFNRSTNWQLEKIFDQIMDNEDITAEYIKMVNEVTKRFKLRTWYTLPKNKKYRFEVYGFDRENLKIEVRLQKDLKQRTIKLSLENFFNLLYQPELFKFDEMYGL